MDPHYVRDATLKDWALAIWKGLALPALAGLAAAGIILAAGATLSLVVSWVIAQML